MTLKRKLQVIAFVYVIEGYPMGIYVDVLQVYFARLGVSTAELGYIMGLKLAWSLKVIWSPLIDRFGLRRHWIAASNVAMGSALFCVSVLGGDHLTMGIWLAVSVYCIASATQDIAIDAYTIGFVDDGGSWALIDKVESATNHVDFYYGNPGDIPFLGDWNGDGIDTPGLYRQSDGYVYLRNSNTQGVADLDFFFGNPGDMPIIGDFNGDGCD
ncbi:MAG: hypothetical protein IIA30_10600, partial [Myxococcales bacterium]|nr:hypothetical protein [Myxococcales bacterium]